MRRSGPERLTRWAAVLALVGLFLMAWSIIVPRPLPVVAFMTLGQVVGTLSLALYAAAVLIDLRRARVIGRRPAGQSPQPV